MKCVVLVSEKMGSFPIAECGGVVLASGDELIVSEAVYARLKIQYGPVLLAARSVEKESLKNGFYEYIAGGQKAVHHAKQSIAPEPVKSEPDVAEELPKAEEPSPVVSKSSDKSMVGKRKRKSKKA